MQFSEVLGNEATKGKLLQSIKENRVSHAQLFVSSEGAGALPLALAYAQYLSCENKQADDSCNTCLSCVKYNKLEHPDLYLAFPIALSKEVRYSSDVLNSWRELVLENPYMSLQDWYHSIDLQNKQGVIGEKESDEIHRRLGLKAFESEYKIVIIWLAEKMNATCANKLLKALEEPADKTVFILITENTEALLPTIVSRTQVISIEPIQDNILAEELVNKHGLEKDLADQIVFQAAGNINKAFSLLHQDVDIVGFDQFRDWMRFAFAGKVGELISWSEQVAGWGREEQKNFLNYAMRMLRECILCNHVGLEHVNLVNEERDFVEKFSPFINVELAPAFVAYLNLATLHIERNANPKILFLDVSLSLCKLFNKSKKTAEA